jgi:preprotein translocase subunit SecB
MAEQANAPQQEQDSTTPQFRIEKIYLKGVSYEAPKTPGQFKAEWHPQVNLDLNTKSTFLEDHYHEVVLAVTVTVKNNDNTAYLIEVNYAGIFSLNNFEKQQSQEILGSFCPSLLYPYVCQTVGDMVLKGGFPQLNLTPINFEAIYRDSLQKTGDTETTVD